MSFWKKDNLADQTPTDDQLQSRKTLWWCNIHHIVNDGYIASLSLLLPFIAADLGLSYAESGLLKTVCQGAISAAQLPAGFLAERAGEVLLLGAGTTVFGLGYAGLMAAITYPLVLLAVLVAGIGGGVYHPVGTGLVADVFPAERSGRAIGTLNFFGDVGKVAFPALTGLLIGYVGWRGSCGLLGGLGAGVGLFYLLAFRGQIRAHRQRRSEPREEVKEVPVKGRSVAARLRNWGVAHPGQFGLYAVIGSLDTAIRSGVMAFLGFLLVREGIGEELIGWCVSLTFLGGAMGKLLCGMPMRRLGAVRLILLTEGLMIAGCWALPELAASWWLVVFLPLFGFVLNGTSSVLYIGLVPTFAQQRRSRGYALYYTLNFIAGATAPFLFGMASDTFGLNAAYYLAGALMLVGLPAALFLREL
ncbi:MAG: MFS transporter [Candidatus Latescibacteria bacterium]|nr:MFS transporter [Candidatus Latescibacterota bacterium]